MLVINWTTRQLFCRFTSKFVGPS